MQTITAGRSWTDTIQAASTLLADRSDTWTGMSGETVTGAAVARHLDTVADLLARHGWVRSYSDTDSDGVDIADDESMTVKDMLRTVLRIARTLVSVGDPRLTLWSAMKQASRSDFSDSDTHRVAERVLDALIKARTGGSGYVSHDSWSERVGRTRDDIAALLAAGADLAHQHGPTA
ncbi:DUF6197 family protein [Streptomyces fradiae]|uniref:DUF6197 family protein n=1 Tax=Streptomyces fradiae TaxID=1906 RepID=UPI0036F5677A